MNYPPPNPGPPWGQQPGWGQPPGPGSWGQPVPPQQPFNYGAPQAPNFAPGYSPFPQPPNPNRSPLMLVLIAVTVIVVAAAAVFAGIYFLGDKKPGSTQTATATTSPATPAPGTTTSPAAADQFAVGDCVSLRIIDASQSDAIPGDCSNNTGPLRVLRILPPGSTDPCQTLISYGGSPGKATYCLVPNLIVGQCYAFSRISRDVIVVPPTCNDPDAFTVVQLVPGGFDNKAACQGTRSNYSFGIKEPNEMVCTIFPHDKLPSFMP